MAFRANNAGVGSSVDITEIEADTLVTEAEGIASNDNDDTLPTSAAVKDYTDTAVSGSGHISDVVDDTTPQLGGDLDCNGSNILTGDAGEVELEDTLGTDTTGTGITATMTVDANSVGFRSALHMDTDGNWIEADADGVATMPCGALALETGTGSKKVLLQGIVRDDSWNWTVGAPIYVSTTVGTLTTTAPSGSSDVVQVVGVALTADSIYFNPSYNMVVVA